ncbi:NAD(P)-binding protein [Meredithblackwellia eburnea MCA 4105]
MAKLTAAVVGSTGSQGLSVLKAFASSGLFSSIRALTRSPTSTKSTSVFSSISKAEDTEIIPTKFDLADRKTVEQAFEGVDVVYALSLPDDMACLGLKDWEGPTELEQGKILAEVAKEKNVKLLFWATLPPITSPKYNGMIHFTDKQRVEELISEMGIPAIFLQLSLYNESMTVYQRVKYDKDTDEVTYTIEHGKLNDKVYAQVSITTDLGPAVALLTKSYFSSSTKASELNHKQIIIVADFYTNQEVLDSLTKATGKKATLVSPPSFGKPGSPYDLMLEYIADPSAPYVDPSKVPDQTLTALGFKFQSLDEFIVKEVKPFLGL